MLSNANPPDKSSGSRDLIRSAAIGICAAIVALICKFFLDYGFDQTETPFLLFPAGIIAAARLGGLKAGVTALATSALFILYFFMPFELSVDQFSLTPFAKVGVFLFEGGLICSLIGMLQRVERVALTNEAKAKVAERNSREYYEQILSTQRKLTALETTYRDLIDSNVIGVMLCRLQGPILEANDALLDIVGYTRAELDEGALNWKDLTPEEYTERDRQAVDEVIESRRVTPYEKKVITKSGEKKNVLVGAAATTHEDVVIAFVLDRSENARFQEELRHALDLAESGNKSKTEFLANISHELRTPLNAIIGMTDLALDEDISDVMRDYVQTAREAAQTLTYLINDILDFSRMETGHFELDNAAFNLPHLIDQTLKTLSLRAHEKGLELISHIAPDVPKFVIGDKNRLRQVVVNIVSNAIKFTEQGEVFIDVTAEMNDDDDVADVLISVIDTGIGISTEDQDRIFSPFTQVDASPTRSYVGTGLGLAICKEITQQMHGSITVSSEFGSGSQFDVRVPLPLGTATSTPPTRSITIDDFQGARVLIVDDNKTSLRTLKSTLLNWRMEVDVASSASEALSILKDAKIQGLIPQYRVLLVDGLMPEIDGFDLVEAVHSAGLQPDLTLLMLSSADRTMFETRCESLPIDGFVEKPVGQSTLMDTLIKLLSGRPRDVIHQKKIHRTDTQPLRILVAEDTPANQKVVQQILLKRGHEVVLANNGREALDLYYTEQFDTILMDMQMPTMDGLQATKAIRQSERESGVANPIPIVALTAHTMKGDRERCLDAGASDYLSKPVDSVALLRMIETLSRPRGRQTTKVPHVTDQPHLNNQPQKKEEFAVPQTYREALRRMGDDPGLFSDMITMFCEDYPEQLDGLKDAISQQDWETAGQRAHRLKGLVYNFGTSLPPCETVLAIEEKVKNQGGQLLDALVSRYENELLLLCNDLKSIQAKLQAAT
ncbi:response regulator [Rubinisphaera margarita]|uniref:response regulator n=1 Tax=Rubinisphaera margarita TaxID=2909586 RepID=UPI0021BC7D79|nr:response regulator [Rubinisphaera margarita]